MVRRIALVFAFIVVTNFALAAHDGHIHKVMGTVTARDATHVEVKTPSGEILSIAITSKTTAVRDKRKVPLSQIEVGTRVVVAIGNGEDPLKAGEIQVGATRIDTK